MVTWEGDTFRKRRLRIAEDTLRMPDAVAAVMGGPSKAEAAAELLEAAGRAEDAKKAREAARKAREAAR